MRFITLLLMATLVFSCGKGKDGHDGNDGAPGEPGAPGADGKPGLPDDEPKPPPLPEDVDKTYVCETKWDLTGMPAGRYYALSYTVLKTKSKEAFASFTMKYHTEQNSLPLQKYEKHYAVGTEGMEAALVSTVVWQASLNSKGGAVFKNLALNADKEVTCTF